MHYQNEKRVDIASVVREYCESLTDAERNALNHAFIAATALSNGAVVRLDDLDGGWMSNEDGQQ
jgi:hypothetical protein